MKRTLKTGLTAAAMATMLLPWLISSAGPALARGAAANIMSSPGYQRRLQESRQQLSAPAVQPAATTRHKKKTRRHHD